MHPLPSGFYPFWFWNDTLTADEIRWQVEEMAQQGIRGFFIHCRQGLKDPAYLSETFFDRVETAVQAARENGLVVHLYDEYPYPSGVAGGLVLMGEPQNLATELIQRVFEAQGGPIAISLPIGKTISLRAFPVEAGRTLWDHSIDLAGAVGVVLEEESYQETGLTSYNQKRFFANRPRPTLQAALPEGQWRIYASIQRVVEQHKYWHHFADVLNPRTVQQFIEFTHQRYFERLGQEFGKTIRWIFTDEVVAGWSARLPQAYQAAYGEDLVALLPALQDETHPAHLRVSAALHNLKLALFAASFEEPVATWCHAHGLAYAAEKPSLRYAQLRYQDIPGCEPGHVKAGGVLDLLQPTLRGNAKATASAAYFYDKDGALDECYHSLGWSATLEDIRWMADAQLLLGIRYLVPHGFFYSTHNLRKHDAPPSLFFQSPFWPLFKHLSQRVERIAQFFEDSYIQAELALLDPTAGLPTHEQRGDYARLMQCLMSAHIDFHVVDCDLLAGGELRDGRVHVKDIAFRAILLPPMRVVEPALETWLERFRAAGGGVIGCPSHFEEDVLLREVHRYARPSLSLHSDGVENPHVWAVQRVAPGQQRWMVLNLSAQAQRVMLNGSSPLEEIALEPDTTSRLEQISGRAWRTLQPFEACLLQAAPQPAATTSLPEIHVALPAAVLVKPLSPNLARLYNWRMTLLDENDQALQTADVQAVPLANQLEQGAFRFAPSVQRVFGTPPLLSWPELHLRYQCAFELDFDGPVELVMEPGSIEGDWSLRMNQSPPFGLADFQPTQAHVRGSLGLALAPWLHAGHNLLTVDLTTDRPDGGLLNPFYLAGDFGVDLNPLRLVERPAQGLFERYRHNRLPYFAGSIDYQATVHLPALPAGARARVLLDFPAPFHEACQVSFNHGQAIDLPWGPYQFDIDPSQLRLGDNEVRLRVFTTLIRSFEGQEFDVERHQTVSIEDAHPHR